MNWAPCTLALDRAAPTKQPCKELVLQNCPAEDLTLCLVANNNVHFLRGLWFSLHVCFCLMNLVPQLIRLRESISSVKCVSLQMQVKHF